MTNGSPLRFTYSAHHRCSCDGLNTTAEKYDALFSSTLLRFSHVTRAGGGRAGGERGCRVFYIVAINQCARPGRERRILVGEPSDIYATGRHSLLFPPELLPAWCIACTNASRAAIMAVAPCRRRCQDRQILSARINEEIYNDRPGNRDLSKWNENIYWISV